MVTTILITGCSRGLGLAMATEFSKAGNFVFATSRGNPTPALQKLIDLSQDKVKHVKLDTTSRPSVEEAETQIASFLEGEGIDILINNAGVMNWMTDEIHTMDDLDSTFNSNVTSAHIVTSTFLPLLKKGTEKKVINMSTTVGSIERSQVYSFMPVPAYKVSKAALNMLTVQYAQSYAQEGFTFLAVSPGVSYVFLPFMTL
ncbi:hypothetical protein OCU04_006970 [Sclerotinia nivalis]|uniref:Uncharacterized protein n=1 Tax=Sclerotinia nivalis TaxID=352851 RepID=A0A9X0AKV3_9HELO|nr:hypothetical protein OCU04_006970 [Sclerotinia nivalis]